MSSDSRIEVQTCPWQVAPALLGSDGALFAIGDVHGYADHLKALQDFIARRIRDSYDPSEVTVVWLGDYIDRGPKPRETLDLVRDGLGIEGVREIALMGNHERFLLDMVDDPDPDKEALDVWLLNGGSDTISALLPNSRESCLRNLGQALRESLGEARLDFLHRLNLTHRAGPYLCAHAGINPDRDLGRQHEEDLLWIREPFLKPIRWPFDIVVIHGHTPQMPGVYEHRIGVDSGVFFSGQLTAVELQNNRLRFLAALSEDAVSFDWSFLL